MSRSDHPKEGEDIRRTWSSKRGIEMIPPHQSNESKPKIGDRSKIGRCKRHWKVELLFVRSENRQRLVVRYDQRGVKNYLGFTRLGCIVILLRD